MMKFRNETELLPDGRRFDFWEAEQLYDRELHVDCNAPNADGAGDGSSERPFANINAAAQAATPGTRVIIHGGVYRETVQPAKGGESPSRMISYEAASGEEVIIKASVEVHSFKPSKDWHLCDFRHVEPVPEEARIWEIELDPEQFKGYNPFCAVNIIHDRLFIEYDKTDMTSYLNRRGMVFIDGKPMKQVSLYGHMALEENTYWVESNGQKVHIRLSGDEDPHNHTVELTNREQCFAPKEPFLAYIKVKGLTLAHAATGAPVPQRGALSCNRGHHWIIEDCTIDWANTVGIDCGNECWHHPRLEGQVNGNCVIRRCVIKDAGVCGIAAIYSQNLLIENNFITGSGWQRMELSWEAGGIKVHWAEHALIRRNLITKCYGCDALWMDIGNVNCRITSNVMLDGIESREHIFIECTRDSENLIDNNIIWGVPGRYDPASVPKEPGSTGWYKNVEHGVENGYGIYLEGTDRLRIYRNLIGNCNYAGFYAKTVAFRVQYGRGGTARKNKLLENIFYNCGTAAIVLPNPHNEADGNTYVKMPPGYLRVMFPEPEMCLDFAAWQEFCGYDLSGFEGDMDITVDSETLVMDIDCKGNAKTPAGPFELKPGQYRFRIDPRVLPLAGNS